MKSLIVYAHPKTGGYCEAILDETKAILAERNVPVEILDLYALGYNPVLLDEEHYTAGKKKISQQTASFQQMITNSDLMIFIYPLWWGSMPAILKGFFDRTLVSGFGFEYRKGIPFPLLKGKRAIVLFTSGGPALFYKILKCNRPAKLIKNDLLGFCGIRTKSYQFGSALHFDDKGKERVKKFVRKTLKI